MPFLPMALDSIINQTYTNLEIICVNDGSSDRTPLVLEEYAKKDKRIRVIHNETNLKLIGTLNKAIALAKGEYIARMDADDISHVERIEKLFNVLIDKNVDIVSCNRRYIDMQGNHIYKGFLRAFTPSEISFSSYMFTPIGHALIVAKKQIFITFPYAVADYALHTEDYEIWTRMVRNGVKFYNHNEVLYSVRISQNSVTRKYEATQRKNFLLCAKIHQEKLLNEKLKQDIVAISVNRVEYAERLKIKAGIRLVNKLFKAYVDEFNPNSEDVKTFKYIVITQKTDILIQTIRKVKFFKKVYFGGQLIVLVISQLFNPRYREFLKLKTM